MDWTEPHRDQVRAEIRAAVKRVLRRRGVREADFEPFIARLMQQAESQYAEWPFANSGPYHCPEYSLQDLQMLIVRPVLLG